MFFSRLQLCSFIRVGTHCAHELALLSLARIEFSVQFALQLVDHHGEGESQGGSKRGKQVGAEEAR